MPKRENSFQPIVIKRLEKEFPGVVVLKNDPTYIQGIPDLSIFYKNKWAMLECKRSKDATHRPNQDYYVGALNEMSFSAFVYPENFEEVMADLKKFFNK